jgi:alpha-1,6-mannosyltransferase
LAIRTLHLTNSWHQRSGGIATFYRQLMDTAVRTGRQISLVVPGPCDEVREIAPDCRIYQLAAPASPLNREYRTIYPHQLLLPGSRVQRILEAERPQLVEICDKYTLLYLAPLLRLRLSPTIDFRPTVVGLSCERMDDNLATYVSRTSLARRFARFYIRNIYFSFFDHHIAVSRDTAEELRLASEGHLVRRGVWIRPMGVDIATLSPSKRSQQTRVGLLQRLGGPRDPQLLLYVGRVVPEKNLELLISVMQLLAARSEDFRLVIAGDGIARQSLEHLATQTVPGKVLFLGHIADREQLSRLYASCDFFLHPNPNEPFGIAPLEAMASGLSVVVPNQGGVTSYATTQNAWCVNPEPVAYAHAIGDALVNPQVRASRIRAARRTAEQYCWPRVAESFLELYDTMHEVGADPGRMLAASPAFISSPASTAQQVETVVASNVAKAVFRAYAYVKRSGSWSLARTQVPGAQPEAGRVP